MFIPESSIHLINKMFLCGLLTIISVGLSADITYAQNKPRKNQYTVKLANSDSQKIALKTILKNPNLTTTYPGCEISNFTLGFLPDGGEFKGPYKISGSKIPENNLNYLKVFTNMKVRIFIDEIHLKCNGKDSLVPGHIYTSIP